MRSYLTSCILPLLLSASASASALPQTGTPTLNTPEKRDPPPGAASTAYPQTDCALTFAVSPDASNSDNSATGTYNMVITLINTNTQTAFTNWTFNPPNALPTASPAPAPYYQYLTADILEYGIEMTYTVEVNTSPSSQEWSGNVVFTYTNWGPISTALSGLQAGTTGLFAPPIDMGSCLLYD